MKIGLSGLLIILIIGVYLLVTKGKSKAKLLWGIILTAVGAFILLLVLVDILSA